MRTLFFFVCASMLLACGGSSGTSGGTTPSAPDTHWREDLSCQEAEPSGQAECEARGCAWQAALFCSGIEQPDARERPRACACVCQEDVVRCMSVP